MKKSLKEELEKHCVPRKGHKNGKFKPFSSDDFENSSNPIVRDIARAASGSKQSDTILSWRKDWGRRA